jgi:sigma-B regulation protein RsbU (phosphoserine phosphatase)
MVVVGDVSGKGVPAAIFMAVTTTLLRTVGRLLHKPEVILRHVNDELANQNPHGMFVTLACAVLEPARGKISYASAGHPSPVLLRPGQPPAYPFDATGMMAGIMVDNEITAIETDLLAGDTYLFYSDGVTEAFNTEGGMFGEKRLLEAAGRGASLPVAELVQTVFQAVADFAGDHPQSDDITLLAVRSPG